MPDCSVDEEDVWFDEMILAALKKENLHEKSPNKQRDNLSNWSGLSVKRPYIVWKWAKFQQHIILL